MSMALSTRTWAAAVYVLQHFTLLTKHFLKYYIYLYYYINPVDCDQIESQRRHRRHHRTGGDDIPNNYCKLIPNRNS